MNVQWRCIITMPGQKYQKHQHKIDDLDDNTNNSSHDNNNDDKKNNLDKNSIIQQWP